MSSEAFSVEVEGGALGGWVKGEGVPVLVLHGGPGLSTDYLTGLVDELADRFRVAWYQQRGLEPSTAGGPYDVGTQADDVVAVLDALGWDRAVVLGHSWGGHLLMHLLARHPQRVEAACVVDTLGAVGDGGMAEFEAELGRRTPPEDAERAAALDQLALENKAGPEEQDESLRLVWPAYFADRETAPPYRSVAMSGEAYAGTFASLIEELPTLATQLRGCAVPTVFVHGAQSPMPLTASTDSAAVMADVVVDVVDAAGHFIWLDRPGVMADAVDALVQRARDRG